MVFDWLTDLFSDMAIEKRKRWVAVPILVLVLILVFYVFNDILKEDYGIILLGLFVILSVIMILLVSGRVRKFDNLIISELGFKKSSFTDIFDGVYKGYKVVITPFNSGNVAFPYHPRISIFFNKPIKKNIKIPKNIVVGGGVYDIKREADYLMSRPNLYKPVINPKATSVDDAMRKNVNVVKQRLNKMLSMVKKMEK